MQPISCSRQSQHSPSRHSGDGMIEGEIMIYHYTIARHAASILRDGVIRPATAFIPKGERPIVWFSANPTWEASAQKAGLVSRDETERQLGPLYRFGVSPKTAPYNFERLVFLAQMDPRIAVLLKSQGIEVGANPDEWFGTFRPVERERWLSVEELVSGVWSASMMTPKGYDRATID